MGSKFKEDSRVEQFDKVVEGLLADHDDGQLDAELVDAAGRVADVALEAGEHGRVQFVAGVGEELALKKVGNSMRPDGLSRSG